MRRFTETIGALDRSPRFIWFTCLALSVVVTLALLFFQAYGLEAASVVYGDF